MRIKDKETRKITNFESLQTWSCPNSICESKNPGQKWIWV